jgi:hypothetical protein
VQVLRPASRVESSALSCRTEHAIGRRLGSSAGYASVRQHETGVRSWLAGKGAECGRNRLPDPACRPRPRNWTLAPCGGMDLAYASRSGHCSRTSSFFRYAVSAGRRLLGEGRARSNPLWRCFDRARLAEPIVVNLPGAQPSSPMRPASSRRSCSSAPFSAAEMLERTSAFHPPAVLQPNSREDT